MEKKINILLVEDNTSYVLILKQLLRHGKISYNELLVAETISAALEPGIVEKKIELILLDLTLPDSEGLQTIRTIRTHFPDSAIIIITSNSDEELTFKALKEGAQNYLTKAEINTRVLERTIFYTLERHNNLIDLRKTQQQLRMLGAHLETVREEERSRISREIHDELGQQLTGIKMDLTLIKMDIMSGLPITTDRIVEVKKMVDAAISEVRKISSELRPPVIDTLGLAASLRWQCDEFENRYKIPCSFTRLLKERPFEKSLTTGVFRIFQETLTNVARHSNAKKINCTLAEEGGYLLMTTKDNGIGFNTGEIQKKTLGIMGMKERALMLGGELKIESVEGKGTTVLLRVPVRLEPHPEPKA